MHRTHFCGLAAAGAEPPHSRRVPSSDRFAGSANRSAQDMAETFAGPWQVVVVLKGEHTVITDGRQTAINTATGMATGAPATC